eukprot:CAMPEP_0172384842 /NCGR_PEP_ID=MMETSP1061-20121228/2564_1 /TAXON_ID=37318 /ORGANISM="Pseudo-nitzschia pungens, Strain cf. pungens" /LENGTH=432 /DNA_ID=CAMNT_0013113623 /DNA_START=30 /DNA_END=1328 /DNA_ORIENTATION=+
MASEMKNGALQLDDETLNEISRGMIYSELSIIDNKEGTLSEVGKANPWHVQAMKLITGSKERAHLPLREILKEDLGGLILDCELDAKGFTKGGHFLDTQGYIAHNDESIVISFRCSTTLSDWMTNLTLTTSAWELEDIEQGYSGCCSGLSDLFCQGDSYKPRVHTGMYNNFLAVLPEVKIHVDPFLTEDEKPRKLYIVGHSLGAGIANMMATYFLLEYNWHVLPQTLVSVTAGSPRTICKSMKAVTDEKRKEFGKKVCFYRIVKGTDAVVRVPPRILGFEHIVEPIIIEDDGQILMRSKGDDFKTSLNELLYTTKQNNLKLSEDEFQQHRASVDEDDEDDEEEDEKYNRLVSKVPKTFRDHMPDFYLKPIFNEQSVRKVSNLTEVRLKSDTQPIQNIQTNAKTEKIQKQWVPKMFRQKKSARRIQKVGPTYF